MSDTTLVQLASRLGVSARSVSRAIRGEAGLSQSTRDRILSLADELGYSPNIQARNLRQHNQNFIGLIVPLEDLHANGYISARKVTSLQIRLEQSGYYTLFAVNTGSSEDLLQLLRQWRSLVSTVIFFSWKPEWSARRLLENFSLHSIFIDQPTDYGHQVLIDRTCGIRDAIDFFIRSGHRRIARCGNVPSRDAGFAAGFSELSAASAYHRHFPIAPTFESGHDIGGRLIREKFDAVFFDSDRMAYGFLKYCHQHRISIPDQVAVIGFDDEPWDQYCYPSLSTVAQPVEGLVDSVMQLIQNPPESPLVLRLETRFIRRESVR